MSAVTMQLYPQHKYMRTVTNVVLCVSRRQDPNNIYPNTARVATCFVPDDDVICLIIQKVWTTVHYQLHVHIYIVLRYIVGRQ
jgi:hypothetical protein